jgi:hypothetical protein
MLAAAAAAANVKGATKKKGTTPARLKIAAAPLPSCSQHQ